MLDTDYSPAPERTTMTLWTALPTPIVPAVPAVPATTYSTLHCTNLQAAELQRLGLTK